MWASLRLKLNDLMVDHYSVLFIKPHQNAPVACAVLSYRAFPESRSGGSLAKLPACVKHKGAQVLSLVYDLSPPFEKLWLSSPVAPASSTQPSRRGSSILQTSQKVRASARRPGTTGSSIDMFSPGSHARSYSSSQPASGDIFHWQVLIMRTGPYSSKTTTSSRDLPICL